MNNNPGLVPLKLGNVQNKISKWTFIQIFDITKIIEEYFKLTQSFNGIKESMEKFHAEFQGYGLEFHNSYRLINILGNRVNNQIQQLNPQNKRLKRGLINGLGNIIKQITGNLDQNDAEKYDNAIKALSNNQNKMKIILENQVTILHDSIEKFKNNSEILPHNQFLLNGRMIDKIGRKLPKFGRFL